MTPSQLIHLARVAGVEVYVDAGGVLHQFKFAYPSPWKPHAPEGVVQLMDLWMALDKKTQGNVVVKYVHKNGLNLSVASARDFTTRLFTHPDEACQIIYEVTGGKEK